MMLILLLDFTYVRSNNICFPQAYFIEYLPGSSVRSQIVGFPCFMTELYSNPMGVSLFVCLFLNNVQELLLALHMGHIPGTTWRTIQNARSNLGQPCAKSPIPTPCMMLSHMYLPYILFQFFCVWMNKNIGYFHRSDQTETARTCIA